MENLRNLYILSDLFIKIRNKRISMICTEMRRWLTLGRTSIKEDCSPIKARMKRKATQWKKALLTPTKMMEIWRKKSKKKRAMMKTCIISEISKIILIFFINIKFRSYVTCLEPKYL